jgi:hypothetical protein
MKRGTIMKNYYTMIDVDNYYYDKQHLDAISQLKNRNINAYILDTSGRSLYTDKEFDSIEEGWISINDYVEVIQ